MGPTNWDWHTVGTPHLAPTNPSGGGRPVESTFESFADLFMTSDLDHLNEGQSAIRRRGLSNEHLKSARLEFAIEQFTNSDEVRHKRQVLCWNPSVFPLINCLSSNPEKRSQFGPIQSKHPRHILKRRTHPT
jgi:hypothetical protein